MGYLNASPQDDYNLQSMAQGGNTTTQLPEASGFDGALESSAKGITSAAGVLGGIAKDALKDTPVADTVNTLFSGVDQANEAFKPIFGYNAFMPFLDNQSRASATAAADVMSKWAATGADPRVTGTLGRTVYGAAKSFGILAGASPVVGPWGAAALLGANDAKDSYKQNMAAGLDQDTSIELAGLAGITSAAGAVLPLGGSRVAGSLFDRAAARPVADLAGKAIDGLLDNTALGFTNRSASWGVLYANGYKAQAEQQKIFDADAIGADAIMGAAFGVHAHLAEGTAEAASDGATSPVIKPSDVNLADVDAAAAVLAQNHFDHSAPGVPVDPGVANTHVKVMAEALDAMANGDEPKVSADDARTLADGTLPDPTHDTAPLIREAAAVDIPQFKDAVDPIPEVEPPAQQAGVPIGPILDAEGQPGPAQFDETTQYRLDRLTSKYGDLKVVDANGELRSVNEIAQQMQQQLTDSDAMGRAHEVAAACFIASGGAA